MRCVLAVLSLTSLAFTGCSISNTASESVSPGIALQGSVHGGQQPIVGARVYLLAANNSGYGGNGIAASTSNASVSVLTAAETGQSDANGAYVLTTAGGSFSLPSYSCTPGNQVYILALGGNPGAGTNSASGLMAALGSCPTAGTFLNTTPFISINEITTVAAAYSLAGFATDSLHISTSGSALAVGSIANAFANAGNLANIANGSAYATTPAGNGTVPQNEIFTLADILASCVNTADSGNAVSAPCSTLFGYALSGGTTGTAPKDTAAAAINIAQNPGANVGNLYNLASAKSPYPLRGAYAQPNDFTLGVTYTGGGLDGPFAVAISYDGSAWFTNLNTPSITKLSSLGVPLSPSAGYTGGNQVAPVGVAVDLFGNAWVVDGITSWLTEYTKAGAVVGTFNGGGISVPQNVAVDGSGDVWTANYSNNSISEFNSSGVAQSPSTGFTGGGLSNPIALAIATNGNVFSTNKNPGTGTITELNASGKAISTTAGDGGGGVNDPVAIAIDHSNNVWVADYEGNSVSEFSASGAAISSSAGDSGAGIQRPYAIAIDGAGNVWTANFSTNSVSELSNSGTALSPSTGYTAGGSLAAPQGIAVDSSGDVWVSNSTATTVTELIGAAVPAVMPLSYAIYTNSLGEKP